MAKLKEVKGDLIKMFKDRRFDVIIHGCNCFHTMGAGIAGQIREQIPRAYHADLNTSGGDYNKMGGYSLAVIPKDEGDGFGYVYNLYSQFEGGANLNYSALELGLEKIARKVPKDKRIGIPLIGCGIAGGKWKLVKKMIRVIFSNHDITVVHYESIEAKGLGKK